jgi:chemotaxis protein MotB
MRRSLLSQIDSDSPDSAPAWMVSYGDLMSLLLTLFVMLVSMSEIKQNDKFQGVADSLHEQFSLNQPASGLPGELQPRSAPLAVLAVAGREARRWVMQGPHHNRANQNQSDISPWIAAGELGFAPGSSELGQESANQLERIAESLSTKPQVVEIRGLAETAMDLELAWQRTQAAGRCLIERHGIEPERIRLTVATALPSTAISGPAHTAEKPMVEVFLVEEPLARVASKPGLAP